MWDECGPSDPFEDADLNDSYCHHDCDCGECEAYRLEQEEA